MMVRGEPDYIDQVLRRIAYEAAHPNVEIIYLGPYRQAIIREEAGQTIITRHALKSLLDKLEALDRRRSGPRHSSAPVTGASARGRTACITGAALLQSPRATAEFNHKHAARLGGPDTL
jgi:hypothetical protein